MVTRPPNGDGEGRAATRLSRKSGNLACVKMVYSFRFSVFSKELDAFIWKLKTEN
jgi:hypothetical protein